MGAAWIAWLGGGALLALAAWAAFLSPMPDDGTAPRLAFAAAAAWIVGFGLLSTGGRKRAAVVLVSAVIGLVCIEGAMRAALGSYYEPYYRPHDAWLYEYRPGLVRTNVVVTPAGRERVRFAINADGYRGAELRPAGTAKRVVVYGDSFIAAVSTRLEETFVQRLGHELAAGLGTEVEVINAGVAGYGPDQALLRMRAELPRLRPDLVVVSVLAQNDYGDVIRNRLVDLGPGGELRPVRHVMTDETLEVFDVPSLAIVRAFSAMRQRMAASAEPLPPVDLSRAYIAACESEHRFVVENDPQVMHPFWDHPDEDLRLVPSSESARYKVALMKRVIAAIRDEAKANGVPLVLLVIPAANDVCPGYDPSPVDLGVFPAYRADNLARPIQEAADALGVPHVDLFGPFTATNANTLYSRDGGTHWNSAGQELAAKLTARRIEELGLLER